MSIEIREVKTRGERKEFVKFPFRLYKGNEFWVPPLIMDDMDTFDSEKNPSFEGADCRLFMAYRDGEPVGRIAGILSHLANDKFETKNIRFGWIEMIDDQEVGDALYNAVADWGRSVGMETMTGPHGFSDMDPSGMLIEGFDQLGTIAMLYTHPYYPVITEKYGFEKEIDYFEFKGTVPHETGIPEKLPKLAERVKERGKFKLLKFNSRKELMKHAGSIMKLMEESFEEIYGSVPASDKVIQYYIKKYFSFVNIELIKVVQNEEGEIIGFMITMPSLSRAMQRARGKLFPFGWYHILKGLKEREILDFYLAGVKEEYRGKGVDLIMVVDIAKDALRMGFQHSESNVELETNTNVHAQWKHFNPVLHKKRRIFTKSIK